MKRHAYAVWLLAPVVPSVLVTLLAAVSLATPGFGSLISPSGPTACGTLPLGAALPDGSTLNNQQAANASLIVAVAQQMGSGTIGAVDAVTAAFTESRLVNVPGGDRDSLGLFQERPSEGWGSPAQILDPVYATRQFLTRLTALPGWPSLAPADAAQAVERSAFPDRYLVWVGPATRLVGGESGTGACTNADSGGVAATALPAGYSLAAGTPAPVAGAIGFALAQLGKPYVWGGVGPGGYDCSGLTMEAYLSSGIALPRTTYDQVYAGQAVYDPADLAAGDLLFVEGSDPGPGGAPGHVGLYIGAGLVIDAPHTGASVQLTRLAGWLPQLVAMRRPVPSLAG